MIYGILAGYTGDHETDAQLLRAARVLAADYIHTGHQAVLIRDTDEPVCADRKRAREAACDVVIILKARKMQ